MQDIQLQHERVFRETKGVKFSDVWVAGQNGMDLVVHDSFAVSPPNQHGTGSKSFYIHHFQTDNNRVISGARVFELVDSTGKWHHPHYFVYLTDISGALEIPPGVWHRSVSSKHGSILINHAVRDEGFDERTEFNPVNCGDNEKLWRILEQDHPRYVNASASVIENFLRTGE